MTAAELNPELRKLIDSRLDAIDRILTSAQIAWSERRSIVGEVETQIFELLSRRSQLPAQEDVLAVLDSLDPPESYIPEDLRAALHSAPADPARPAAAAPPAQPKWQQLPQQTIALVANIVPKVLCAIALVIVNGIIVMILVITHGVIPWLVALGGLAWLNFTGVRRYRAWSATRQGNVIDDLRHSVAAWLMPKNGTQTT
jgi:hypothetical protein